VLKSIRCFSRALKGRFRPVLFTVNWTMLARIKNIKIIINFSLKILEILRFFFKNNFYKNNLLLFDVTVSWLHPHAIVAEFS